MRSRPPLSAFWTVAQDAAHFARVEIILKNDLGRLDRARSTHFDRLGRFA